MVYGLVLFTTFLEPLRAENTLLILAAASLSAVGFAAISLWTIMGMALTRIFTNSKQQKIINIILSVLLVYTALNMSTLMK